MISEKLLNRYRDFYNYLVLERDQRKLTAVTNVQKIHVFFKYTDVYTAESVRDVFAQLAVKGVSNNYTNKIRDVVRLYGHYLRFKGQEVDQSIFSIKKLKEEPVMRAIMNDSEIEQFLELPAPIVMSKNQYVDRTWETQPSKKAYEVWTLFFTICAYTGMRPQEVATLTVDQVDFGRKVFILPVTKTIPRLVPIPPNIERAVKTHVENCTQYLFPSRNGGNARFGIPVVSNVQWGYNFHARLKRLGIKRKGLTPYSLRHSLITRLLEEDVNLFKVQKIVGHKKVETTARYTHMTTKDMHMALNKHPIIRRATDPKMILNAFKEVVRSFEFEKNGKFQFSMQESNNGLSVQIKLS